MLGGWVGAWLASKHDRVHSLQLLSSGGTRVVPEITARIRDTMTRAAMDEDPPWTRDRLGGLFHDRDRCPEELVDMRYAINHSRSSGRRRPGPSSCRTWRCVSATSCVPTGWAGSRARPGSTGGLHNPMGDTSEAEGIHAAVRRSGMTVCDECGHFLRWKHPERFAADSVAFLMTAEACP